jgi:hypothetical protein
LKDSTNLLVQYNAQVSVAKEILEWVAGCRCDRIVTMTGCKQQVQTMNLYSDQNYRYFVTSNSSLGAGLLKIPDVGIYLKLEPITKADLAFIKGSYEICEEERPGEHLMSSLCQGLMALASRYVESVDKIEDWNIRLNGGVLVPSASIYNLYLKAVRALFTKCIEAGLTHHYDGPFTLVRNDFQKEDITFDDGSRLAFFWSFKGIGSFSDVIYGEKMFFYAYNLGRVDRIVNLVGRIGSLDDLPKDDDELSNWQSWASMKDLVHKLMEEVNKIKS